GRRTPHSHHRHAKGGRTVSHVLITGGASGIGAATAQQLTGRGTRVSVLDRSPADADTAAGWHALDPAVRGHWAVCDAADAAALEAAVDQIAADDLTGLVACAGISVKEPFVASTDEVWRQTIDINVHGTVIAVRSIA